MKLNNEFYTQLISQAEQSDRKRAHHNLHNDFEDPVQRLCIALKKGTYVKPHHHTQSYKWELILVLKGELGLVIFDEDGKVIDKEILTTGGSISGMELTPNTWHTVYPVTQDAVILEVKQGPYTPAQPSDFANWAPNEGDPNVPEFLSWLESANIQDKY